MKNVLICTLGYAPGVVTTTMKRLTEGEYWPLPGTRKGGPQMEIGQVCVLYPSDGTIAELFSWVVRRELQERFGLDRRSIRAEVLGLDDVTAAGDVQECHRKLVEVTVDALTSGDAVVHVCISGGRKAMTHAASLALVEVAARQGGAIGSRLRVWNTQLPREDELKAPHIGDLQDLTNQYRTRPSSIPTVLPSSSKIDGILYPLSAECFEFPRFSFAHKATITEKPQGPEVDWDATAIK